MAPADVLRSSVLRDLPQPWPEDLLPQIQAALERSGSKLLVLDDDPTGTQTVHGVDVLTSWEPDELTVALRATETAVYLSTNSRACPGDEAIALTRGIAQRIRLAAASTHREVVVVSRSDSTLRGHYPAETDALALELGGTFDGLLLVPFFAEGGRLTIGDVHYLSQGSRLYPVAATEYARDQVFGYRNSNLRAWVLEKSAGSLPRDAVVSLALATIRQGGPDAVFERLMAYTAETSVSNKPVGVVAPVFIVNAASYRDLEVVVAGLLRAEAEGKRFLYRTAASFVRVRAGIDPQPLLTACDLAPQLRPSTGGIVVVGSHVELATRQLAHALALGSIVGVELAVQAVLSCTGRQAEIDRAAAETSCALEGGRDAIIYTSRDVVSGSASASSRDVGRAVSQALVETVASVRVRPEWVIAKGGTTSADVAKGALSVRRARVLGQAIPGVPVWRTGSAGRWPGLVYVVFPGNVGGDDDLSRMIRMLRLSDDGAGDATAQ